VSGVAEQLDPDVLRAAVLTAARAADDKKADDVVVLDVGDVLSITGWFVITSGANPRQVRTIAEEVEAKVKAEHGIAPLRVEGLDGLRWVLLDYGDFVVHVFSDEAREFYAIEDIWGDAPRLDWDGDGPPPPAPRPQDETS
jgi:ribosome-associated protein